MNKKTSFISEFKAIVFLVFLIFLFIVPAQSVFAKRPPEIRNQEELNISSDMSGQDLSGDDFVKLDLKGINFSESNLTGAVFNNSKLNNANLHGAQLNDSLAYATDFEGADFTDAVISRIQQKELCSMASGTNSKTEEDTSYSLGC